MAAFAELERDIIHERTMAGLKAARAQGKVGGRPTVMDPDKLAAAQARRERGESPTQIARSLGVSRASVYRHLADAESEDWGTRSPYGRRFASRARHSGRSKRAKPQERRRSQGRGLSAPRGSRSQRFPAASVKRMPTA
jgi:transposase-like protein